jgi:PAS domain S-box-containing protein
LDKRLGILLVEDNPGDARLIQEMLRSISGVELSCVECLSAALDHLAKHSPDIVLLDLGLPDSQGLETVRRVASRMPMLPIIVLTGLGDDMIALDSLKAGAQDYIVKGLIESEGLMRAIRYAVERKLTEVALRESEERYRLTLEGMVDAVSIQGIGNARYLYVNKAFCDITGYALEEIVGKTPSELNLPLTPEDQDSYLGCILERSGREQQEIQYRMKNGRILYALLSCTPVQYRGEDCAVVVMTDITALKQSEQNKKRLEIQLAQAHKMEALGTLAGGIAHDFNNLLTAIMGYTEIAKLNISEPDKIQKSLNDAIRSCKRAKDLIGQILAFSRHAEAKYALVNLNYVIGESLGMLRAMLPSNIEIRQNLAIPGKVMADPSQMNQVMMNLSINAAQAMDEHGGVLEVSLERVSVDETAGHFLELTAGPYLKLTVSDTGQGMTPDIVDRIFEPYFTTKKRGNGTGMGLSIVHGILKRHGGAITCKSIQGKGTTFEIYLPEAVAKEETTELPPVEAGIPTGTESILFIDDEPDLVEVARGLLEALGYKVTATNNSTEALEFLRSAPSRFDLVVTDMTMPEMMGDKLAQKMVEIRPDLPIILYTGYSEHITEKKAKSIGIRELVMKPFEMKDMARIIRKVLDAK